MLFPIPVAVRSKAQFCNRLIAKIAGSYSAGVVDVRLLCLLCVCAYSGLCDWLITHSEEPYRGYVSNYVRSRNIILGRKYVEIKCQ